MKIYSEPKTYRIAGVGGICVIFPIFIGLLLMYKKTFTHYIVGNDTELIVHKGKKIL